MKHEGIIGIVEDKGKGRYRLQIGKLWFTSFGKPQGEQGEQVSVEYTQDAKGFKTIQSWSKQKTTSKKTDNRSFALSYAKDIAVAFIEQGKDIRSEKILDLAEKFRKYLDGE